MKKYVSKSMCGDYGRRGFLKTAAVSAAVSAVGVALPVSVLATQVTAVDNSAAQQELLWRRSRRFMLTQTYDLKVPMGSRGEMRLWVPLPMLGDVPFQKLNGMNQMGNYSNSGVTTDPVYGAAAFFASWEHAQEPMSLTLAFELETRSWEPMRCGELSGYVAPQEIVYPQDVQLFLEPTIYMPVDGIVRQTMQQIVGAQTDPLKKAWLIYNWVTENMYRDNSVVGCGVGDANATLTSGNLGGKCTDISSVFVALMRSAGIPAREVFGLRLGRPNYLAPYSSSAFGSSDDAGLANVSSAQHCRAEFYLAGFGWVPCDPADVTKMRLTEDKPHSDPAVQAVNRYLFGNWDMNWVGFNYARDFNLEPSAVQTPINNFGYPYAEVDGDPLNYYDPLSFAYDYVSQEL